MRATGDDQIQRNVLDELARDSRVHPSDVGVQVTSGVVTLTGIVPTYTIKSAACEAAHRAAGVLDVANNLTVKNIGQIGISDTDIAIEVRRALQLNHMVPAGQIETTIAHGMVSMYGTVETALASALAEELIRRVDGVLVIVNMLQVADPGEQRPAGQGETRRPVAGWSVSAA